MELSALWPGAEADMSYGLITGHSDPRGQSSGFGQSSTQEPGEGSKAGPGQSHPMFTQLPGGKDRATGNTLLSPGSLAWLGSTEREDGVGLFTIKDIPKEDCGKLRVRKSFLCRRGPS